ncbi:HIRAN domain-containing protein [Methylobacterium sp. A52T]
MGDYNVIERTIDDDWHDHCGYEQVDRELTSAIANVAAHGLDLSGVRDTPLGVQAFDLANGTPWTQCEIAGLQFYDYAIWDEDLGRKVIPQSGDYLNLVRAPDNYHDENAVEVWWRNGVRIGHLPRAVASVVAGPMDLGQHLSAYVADGGTGEAWSAKAVLIGEPVRSLHERRFQRVIRQAIDEHVSRERWAERKRRELGRDHGWAFEREQADRRRARLVQAAKTLLATVPLEVDMPPVGRMIELATIETILGVSRSTARRVAERAGCRIDVDRRGWFATGSHVEVTPQLQQAIQEQAARPLRIRADDVRLSSGTLLSLRPARTLDDDIPF